MHTFLVLSLISLSPYSLRWALSIKPELAAVASLASRLAVEIPSAFWGWNCRWLPCPPSIPIGSGDPNFVPHSSRASGLFTEPSLQSPHSLTLRKGVYQKTRGSELSLEEWVPWKLEFVLWAEGGKEAPWYWQWAVYCTLNLCFSMLSIWTSLCTVLQGQGYLQQCDTAVYLGV